MRFYDKQHQFYCGVDLHARTLYLCILDKSGEIRFHRNVKARPDRLLQALKPYREDIVVARLVRGLDPLDASGDAVEEIAAGLEQELVIAKAWEALLFSRVGLIGEPSESKSSRHFSVAKRPASFNAV